MSDPPAASPPASAKTRSGFTLLRLSWLVGAGLIVIATLLAAGMALGLALAAAGLATALGLAIWVMAAGLLRAERPLPRNLRRD